MSEKSGRRRPLFVACSAPAIVGLGASLGINTTAEGVETALQLEMLRSEHCGELQGCLFSPPVPDDGARAIIEAYFGQTAAVA